MHIDRLASAKSTEISPFERLRFRKMLTCRRSRGSVLIAQDRVTGDFKSVRAIDTKASNGGVDDGVPTSILREIAQSSYLDSNKVTKFERVFIKDHIVVLQRPHIEWDLRDFI